MKINLKGLFSIIIISLLIGAFTCYKFIKKERIVEVPIEIKPTEHEINELVEIRSKGIIDSLKNEINIKPKIIYKEKIINGESKIDSIKIYPKGYVDIKNIFSYEKYFKNENRDDDYLYISFLDSVRVEAYSDSSGKEYIGYDEFVSTLKDFKLTISPEIITTKINYKYKLFITSPINITFKDIINNNYIEKEKDISFGIGIGLLLNDNIYINPAYLKSNKSETYSLNFGFKILNFKKNIENIK
jgi:hypothetical protein